MKLLHYILALPLFIIAAWAIYSAESTDGITFLLWPQDKTSISWNTQLVLFVFLLYGYICGRIGAWFAQAPMRRELRLQKKANRNLTKEQNELNKTVSGLKQNVTALQEQAKIAVNSTETDESGILAKIKYKFLPKK
jgi:cell division protein FtsB